MRAKPALSAVNAERFGSASLLVASSGGARVALHDLGGRGPVVLFTHANGFCGQMWQPVAQQLKELARCWALDFRGHGDSIAGPEETYNWANLADDVLTAVGALDPQPRLAVGHSVGAASILAAELACPGTFDRAWLYEPVTVPKTAMPKEGVEALAQIARMRQDRFESRQAAYDRYFSRPPLSLLDPEVLRAYVDSGFRTLSDGTVTMKCAPEVEAAVFENADTSLFSQLGSIRATVTVCGSPDTDPPAQFAAKVAEALPNGGYEHFAELTHFGPLQAPKPIAASITKTLFPAP
ncbi:MAG: alpha/beta hydrolase [bacterium]|nr:alpha/beta hydrolase [bacterium]